MIVFLSLLRVLGFLKSFKKRTYGISYCTASPTEISLNNTTKVIPFMKDGDKEVNSQSLFGVKPIGLVRSPYIKRFNTPKQATIENKNGTRELGQIEIFPEYRECMHDLERFDFIWALTLMHLNSGFKTKIKPMPNPSLSDSDSDVNSSESLEVGLFCSRAPHRPNPIALSCLKVLSVNVVTGIIEVDGLDLLDKTPVLDIKPYVPAFDCFPQAKAGWMDDITSSQEDARRLGYQAIHSKRGMIISYLILTRFFYSSVFDLSSIIFVYHRSQSNESGRKEKEDDKGRMILFYIHIN